MSLIDMISMLFDIQMVEIRFMYRIVIDVPLNE
jgi:hypothetical protein